MPRPRDIATTLTSLVGTESLVADQVSGPVAKITPSNARKYFSPFLNVKDFGATGDGTTNDTTAIQNALNAINTINGGTVFFPAGRYLVTGLTLPSAVDTAFYTPYAIIGDGRATLLSTSGAPILTTTVPADQATAEANIARRFLIEGIRFEGNNAVGQIGLRLTNCHAPIVRACGFHNCNVGLDLIFALGAQVDACESKTNTTYACRVRSGAGVWTGATGSNSASNHVTVEAWRDYAATGQTNQFRVEDCDGVSLLNCIAEGGNPVEAVYYNSTNNTSARSFYINNMHVENVPTGAFFRVVTACHVHVHHMWTTVSTVPLVDATGSSASAVIELMTHAAPKLKHGGSGATWMIYSPGLYGKDDLTATSFWADGTAGRVVLYGVDANGSGGQLKSGVLTLYGKDEFHLKSDRTGGFIGISMEGPTEIRAGTSAAAAGLMQNSMICPSLDETTKEMRWVVKESGGTDYTARFLYNGASTLTNSQTGTAYTLVLTDAGKTVEMNNAAANTLTVPPNSSVAFPVGTVIEVVQMGAGATSVAAGAGVTIRSLAGDLTLGGQYASARLRKRATDEWVLAGGL